jgi:CspA family cold shock protein
MSSTDFVTGSVKWFDPIKGYGFAVGPDGKDVFIHNKRLRESGIIITQDASSTLEVGEKLKFKVEQGPKGAYAVKISKA